MSNFMTKGRAVAATAIVLASVFLVSGVASAQSYISGDPTGGAAEDFAADIATWVWTYGVPALFSLLAVGIILRLVLRFIRRAASQV